LTRGEALMELVYKELRAGRFSVKYPGDNSSIDVDPASELK
jgi:hypothetical protein